MKYLFIAFVLAMTPISYAANCKDKNMCMIKPNTLNILTKKKPQKICYPNTNFKCKLK